MRLPLDTFLEVVRHTPLISIDLVVRDAAGTILVGLRNNRPAQDCWFVPGGRICKDERIADAIRRIAEEELGTVVTLDDATPLGVFEPLYPDNAGGQEGFGTHYIVLAYSVSVEVSALKLDRAQHREYRWRTATELLVDDTVHANTKAYFESSPSLSRR